MIADEMVKQLIKDFWCFETYTEYGQEYAEKMAVKNAIKHCQLLLNTDPSREYYEYDFHQNKLGVDDDYWQDVAARLEKLWERIKNKNDD